MEKNFFVTDERCYYLGDNKQNLYQILFTNICAGRMPICPHCGMPLIDERKIAKNPLLKASNIFNMDDIIENIYDAKVQAFIKQLVSIEHIFATSNGGTDHYANLVLLHSKCNIAKGNNISIPTINLAKNNNLDDVIYISRGCGIHIFELIANNDVKKLEDVPKYVLDCDFSNKDLYFRNNIFC